MGGRGVEGRREEEGKKSDQKGWDSHFYSVSS